MVKRILLVGSLVSSIAMGGCSTFPTPSEIATDVSGFESQVQADTQLACGFIPTIATIAALIPGVGVIAADAATIAGSICTAIAQAPPVTTSSARLKSLRANVPVSVAVVKLPNGKVVPIAGTFTR
jgi:hypothetical protein